MSSKRQICSKSCLWNDKYLFGSTQLRICEKTFSKIKYVKSYRISINRWTFVILMKGNLNLANVIPPKSILSSRPVLPKIVANYYYIWNFNNKKFVEICFLSCYVSTYIKQPQSGLLALKIENTQFADPALGCLLGRRAGQWQQSLRPC